MLENVGLKHFLDRKPWHCSLRSPLYQEKQCANIDEEYKMRPLWYKFLSKLVHCINSRHCMLKLILGWQTSAFPCKSHSKVSVVPPLNSLHTSLKYITELKDELFYLVWKVSTITYSSKNINCGVQVITRNLKTLEKTKISSFSQPCTFFFSNF